jgi:hypothetical protein
MYATKLIRTVCPGSRSLERSYARHRKDALFEAIGLMSKAFASPRRLELLDLLAQAPRTVGELARASGQSGRRRSFPSKRRRGSHTWTTSNCWHTPL